jgi:PAS domain-containing protein
MTSTTDLIFVYFKNGEPEAAGRYNAAMDRTFGQVLDEIAKAETVIRAIQSRQFQAQLGDAGRLGRFEYLIGGIIFVIVILVVLYGHRMQKVMAAAEAERLRLIAALKESEATAQGRLHDAIESMNGGFVLYDGDDRLVMRNETYRQMYPETRDSTSPAPSSETSSAPTWRAARCRRRSAARTSGWPKRMRRTSPTRARASSSWATAAGSSSASAAPARAAWSASAPTSARARKPSCSCRRRSTS